MADLVLTSGNYGTLSSYASYYSLSTQVLTNVETTMPLDTLSIKTSDITVASNVMTINNTGIYIALFVVNDESISNTGGTTRNGLFSKLLLNGNDTNDSDSVGYARLYNTTPSYGQVFNSVIVDITTSGDTLEVVGWLSNDQLATADYVTFSTKLIVFKISS